MPYRPRGRPIFVAGVIVTLMPAIVGLIFGRLVLKLDQVLLFGALTGAETCTAALNAGERGMRQHDAGNRLHGDLRIRQCTPDGLGNGSHQRHVILGGTAMLNRIVLWGMTSALLILVALAPVGLSRAEGTDGAGVKAGKTPQLPTVAIVTTGGTIAEKTDAKTRRSGPGSVRQGSDRGSAVTCTYSRHQGL